MPIKWKKKTIQIWWRKWDIKNLKTNSNDINMWSELASWVKTRLEGKERIAKMNLVKLQNWITWWRKRKYSVKDLLQKCNDYFHSNILFEEIYDDEMNIIDVEFKRMKAMSVFWLCNFLEISYSSFREMSSTKEYWQICLQAKQKIMDHYIVWWLEWEFDSKVASVIVNMQMQNERIQEWLDLEDWKTNLFQKIEINVITKDWEKKIDPIKIIEVKSKEN